MESGVILKPGEVIGPNGNVLPPWDFSPTFSDGTATRFGIDCQYHAPEGAVVRARAMDHGFSIGVGMEWKGKRNAIRLYAEDGAPDPRDAVRHLVKLWDEKPLTHCQYCGAPTETRGAGTYCGSCAHSVERLQSMSPAEAAGLLEGAH